MGNYCFSSSSSKLLIDNADGNEQDFHERYLQDAVLGQGEFGVVCMVHDVTQPHAVPLACKTLKKGLVFKDNTLYTPLKPEILRGEVEMLRTLQGDHHCLQLQGVYETPKLIYVVTEYCGGGELMEYVAAQSYLEIPQVSRIAAQLLQALAHCAAHGVIHRDVKPENCMFVNRQPEADLKLIDFGSGSMSSSNLGDDPVRHTTFAGTAFYISPEVYQRTYTTKTDVWSAGVVLYVLVAGYPSQQLQRVFNWLQQSTVRDWSVLDHVPQDLPESYYQLVNDCLVYKHRHRPTAAQLQDYEFCQLHQQQQQPHLTLDDVAATAQESRPSLAGTVLRHTLFLGFKQYERSVTTLLAALLSKKELTTLVASLKTHTEAQPQEEVKDDDEKGVSKNLQVVSVQHLQDELQRLGYQQAYVPTYVFHISHTLA